MSDSKLERAEFLLKASQSSLKPEKPEKYVKEKETCSNFEHRKTSTTLNVDILESALRRPRVERICGRAKGIWLPNEQKVLVEKTMGNIFKSIGQQEKRGYLLLPEEALYLLESNKLMIYWNDVPFSIQQAYTVFLTCPSFSLEKYKLYRKLLVNDYKVISGKDEEPFNKRLKLERNTGMSSCFSEKFKNFIEIFHEMQGCGPNTSEFSFENPHILYEVYPANTHSLLSCFPKFSIDLKQNDESLSYLNQSTSSNDIPHVTSVSKQNTLLLYEIFNGDIGNLLEQNSK